MENDFKEFMMLINEISKEYVVAHRFYSALPAEVNFNDLSIKFTMGFTDIFFNNTTTMGFISVDIKYKLQDHGLYY